VALLIASKNRVRAARAIGVCVDLVQLGLPYVFGEGFLSPLDDILDVVACLTLTALIGWHIAFLPTFLIELLPVGDLAPTWTIAVLIATRDRTPPQPVPPALPPAANSPSVSSRLQPYRD
jgi:hypothetical protein